MPISDLKGRIARLPEQPGVYLFSNAAGETDLRGQGAVAARPRPELPRRPGHEPEDRRAARRGRRGSRSSSPTRWSRRWRSRTTSSSSGRRKYNILLRDDKNYPYLKLTTAEAFPRVLVARRVERDGQRLRRPVPARAASRAATMALTHRLFGIRSCNEVITGQRGRPCLEYDIKRCIAPCVASMCAPEGYAARRRRMRGCSSRGGTTNWSAALRAADGRGGRRRAVRAGRAAARRDRAPSRRSRDRQQKMATVELGDRDAFGIKVGAGGRVRPGVPGARRAGRSSAWNCGEPRRRLDAASTDRAAEVLEAALQQFYEDRDGAARGARAGGACRGRRRSRRGCPRAPAVGCGSSCRSGARSAALLDLATRNAALAYDTRFNAGRRRPLRRARHAARGARPAGAAAADRVLRHLDHPGQRDRRVDGRLRGRPDEAAPSTASSASGARGRADGGWPDDFAAMHEVVLRRYAGVLEAGGPLPDLDPDRRRQGAAVGRLRGARGARAGQPGGRGPREEGGADLHARPGRTDRAPGRAPGPAAAAADSRRGPPLRRDVPPAGRAMRDLRSELDGVPGIGPRRRRVC